MEHTFRSHGIILACIALITFACLNPPQAFAVDSVSDDNTYYAFLYEDGTLVVQGTDTPDPSFGTVEKSMSAQYDKWNGPWDYRLDSTLRDLVCSKTKRVIVGSDFAPTNLTFFFDFFTACTSFDLGQMDTSRLEDMTGMFQGCSSLESIDLSKIDLSNVLKFTQLFKDCASLQSVSMGSGDYNASSIARMFEGCTSLEHINLSQINFPKLEYADELFKECVSLVDIKMPIISSPSLKNLIGLFQNCSELTYLNVGHLNASNMELSLAYNTFLGCSRLETLDLSGFCTPTVTNDNKYGSQFLDTCQNLRKVIAGPNCDISKCLPRLNDSGFTGEWVNARGTSHVVPFKEDTYIPQRHIDAEETTIALTQDPIPYCKNGVSPKIQVSIGDYIFKEEIDFAIQQEQSYPSVGTVDAKIQQQPVSHLYSTSHWFLQGSKSFTYTIAPANLGGGDFSIENLDDTWFNNEPVTPYFIVIDKRCEYNNMLTEGEDYTVTYLNNTEPGTGTVLVKGVGNYTGELRKSFRVLSNDPENIAPPSQSGSSSGTAAAPSSTPVIPKSSLDKASISVKPKAYTGKAQTCGVPTVKVGGKTLRYKTDFTYTCKAGKKIGSYLVTIKGKGAYTGSKTAKFQIVPKGVSAKKPAAAKRGFTAKWARPASKFLSQTTGYQVQWSTDKAFKKSVKSKLIKGAKKTSLKVGKLKAKKTYYVKVRTYKQVGKAKYYSSWSKAQKVRTR